MAEIWGAAVAAVGVGASLYSSSQSAKGQQSAADAAAAEQARQFDITQANQAPYREAGTNALAQLTSLAPQFGKAPTAEEVMATPGYQFALTQGTNALEGSAAARGGLYSGNTGKELVQFGQGNATQYYNDAFNRNRLTEGDTWNRYAGLAGIGQTATNQLQSAGQNYANSVGNIGMSNANAQGAATISQGNALQNGINQGVSWWNNRSSPNSAGMQSATNLGNNNMPGTIDPNYSGYFADGGPVMEEGYAYGGPIGWDDPQQVQGVAPPPMAQPMVPGRMQAFPTNQTADTQPMMQQPMPFRRPMFQGISPAMGIQNRRRMAFADGGPVRREPVVGTRTPLPQGGGGGLSTEALLALLAQQQMQQMQQQPQVGYGLNPRLVQDVRMRRVGLMDGGPVQGPGGPKDDAIPAWLSSGEHVVDTAAVNAIGGGSNPAGQQKLNRLRATVKGVR